MQNDGAGLLHITDHVTITSSLTLDPHSSAYAGVISLKCQDELSSEKTTLQVSGDAKIINTRTEVKIGPTIYNESYGKVLLTGRAEVLGNADCLQGTILLMKGERGTISLETASPDVVIKNENSDMYEVAAIRHIGKGKLVLRGGFIDGNYGRAVSMGSIFANTTGNMEIHKNTILTAKGLRTVLINNAEDVQDMFIMTGGTIISAHEEGGTGNENTQPSVQDDELAMDNGFESKKNTHRTSHIKYLSENR